MDQAFIELHYPRIHRMAWTMTGCASEAEDMAQETFIVALDRWDSFDGRSQRTTWLIGILMHLKSRRDRAIGRFKRRLTEYVHRKEHCRATNPEMTVLQREWQQTIWSQVARLPPQLRDIMVLRFAEQLTLNEIAELVGCPVGTVKTRLHRATKRLEQFPEMRTLQTQQPNLSTHSAVIQSWIESATY